MTGRQKSKLSMFEAVESVCGQYRHVWGQLPAFRGAYERFQKELQALSKLTDNQKRHTGGVAQRKVKARTDLCSLAFEIASAVRASALAAGDLKVAGKLAYSLTQLRIGKDQLCVDRCRQILATAQSQKALADYGVTEQRLGELSQALETF